MKPNWEETSKEEWEPIVRQLTNRPKWIMDGNYGSTIDMRLERADTVIFLDHPTWRCLFRVIRRTIKHYKKVRPGMAAGCKERFSLSFLHYVLTYRLVRRESILNRLKAVKDRKQVYIFSNDQQVDLFLADLSNKTY